MDARRTPGAEGTAPVPGAPHRARRGNRNTGLRLVMPILAVLAVACAGPASDEPRPAGPAVQVGAGVGGSGAWTAWAYPTTDGGSCLEVRGIPGAGTSCMSADATAMGQAGTEADVLISGGTAMPGAASVSVTFGDGSLLRVPLLGAAGLPHRYFVTVVSADRVPVRFALVDATGGVLEQVEIDRARPLDP